MANTSSKKKRIILICAVICVLLLAFAGIFIYEYTLRQTEHTVTFYSNDGTILKIDSVKGRKNATPPPQPEMAYGEVFVKWDGDFTGVTEDVDIRPISRSVKGEQNVFAMPGTYGESGGEVTVPLMLCGDVRISGFDLEVTYDPEMLELLSVFNEDGGILYNDTVPGTIKINYVSVDNTTADVDICSFKFKIKGEADTSLKTTILNAYAFNNDDLEKIGYTIIDPEVFVVN